MNDYKELVKRLRMFCLPCHGEEKSIGQSAADVIEHLQSKCERLVSDYEILAKMYAKVNEELCIRTKDRDDLERILSEVIEERDKAIEDISEYKPCTFCKHYGESMCDYPSDDCFEWRGVQEDNT